MNHIFISYSHKESDYAHGLAQTLYKDGFDVWIDDRLDYGSQWPNEIQKQLDSCRAFIVIMSPNSFGSEWVQSELQRAKRKKKPIFPLLLGGDGPWLSVESTQFFDVRGGVYPDAKFYSALKRVIRPDPSARTLRMPKAPRKAKLRASSLNLNPGMIAATIGALVFFLLLSVTLLWGLFSKDEVSLPTQMANPTMDVVLLDEPTAVPTPTASPAMPEVEQTVPDEMALIPAGEFTMGMDAFDEFAICEKIGGECRLDWFMDEEPIHTIYLDAFYMDIYEVTNIQYKGCVDSGECDSPEISASTSRLDYYDNPEFDHYPVINVTWYQAQAYCEWSGGRLPTEAEWEKAARGTEASPFPWGDTLDPSYANYNYTVGDTTAVGSYEKGISPYGLYDMAGNVWEWVSSLHGSYPYAANDGREAPSSENGRIMRGGSWGYVGVSISTSYRYTWDSSDSNLDLGFRCARDVSP